MPHPGEKGAVGETVLGLGSNLGDRLGNLRKARALLRSLSGCREAAASGVYETEPVGVRPEHRTFWFLNAVLVFAGGLTPEEWLKIIRDVERRLGRVREGGRNSPRTIDVDLLLCGAHYINRKELAVPHPRLRERLFVLVPLAEVRPALVIPGTGRRADELAGELGGHGAVRLLVQRWEPEEG